MLITVATYHGALPLELHTSTDPTTLPTRNVAWVDVEWGEWRQRLMGRDYAWVAGNAFGTFNSPANLSWYGGDPAQQSSAWLATQHGSTPVSMTPPEIAVVFEGVLLPDDEWEVARAY